MVRERSHRQSSCTSFTMQTKPSAQTDGKSTAAAFVNR
jgi:hypothetical protein